MNILPLILLILAALLFLGAAFGASIRGWNLSALGLFCFTIAIMLLRYVATAATHALAFLAAAILFCSCTSTSTFDGKTTTKVTKFDADSTVKGLEAVDRGLTLIERGRTILKSTSDGKTVR